MSNAKKSDKNNKKSKILQLKGEIREIKMNYFTRKKNDMYSNINFKIISRISNYGRYFFNISFRTRKLLSRWTSKSKLANRVKSFFFF